MKRADSEKVADALIDGVNRFDWNPYLFVGILMGQPIDIQRRIVDVFIVYLRTYQRNAQNEHLAYRTDPYAASQIESIDLTEFDQ